MPDGSQNGAVQVETSLSDQDFETLRKIVYDQTSITIGEGRKNMVFTRLQRRLRETGIGTFKGYIARVMDDAEEMQQLTNRMTTNETYFYRTPRVWDHLRSVCIPEFLESKERRAMKVWSAASSTGEEGHTLGIILEDVRKANPGFDYSVLGTDISSRVVGVAEEGLYLGRPIARFRKAEPDLFKSYMVGDDTDGFRVRPEIKKKIKFKLHNLFDRLKVGGPFDVVFLRNVLIYFTDEDQEKLLKNIHEVLRPDGTLIIGESETLGNLECNFVPAGPLIYKPCRPGQRGDS